METKKKKDGPQITLAPDQGEAIDAVWDYIHKYGLENLKYYPDPPPEGAPEQGQLQMQDEDSVPPSPFRR